MRAPMSSPVARLRRDLGTLESYAALIGILIGAGVFKVTGQAWLLTGPSVVLGYLVLAPAVLATSVSYAVFLSTPLGREPGGEYSHLRETFGPGAGRAVAFVGAWLKAISYIGALAFLALACGEHLSPLLGGLGAGATVPIALASLLLFYAVHVSGVRFFGRMQVAMCALLGVSIVVLVLPGLAHIDFDNYVPFFTHGLGGFALSLPPLFFAYAGFESLAQTAGEVKDSTRRLPGVFLKGIAATTVVFLLMSGVALGVLPGAQLAATPTPMVLVGAVYLHAAAAWFVNLGAVMALTTSLNATFLVPSRLGLMLAADRLAPAWLARVHPATGTPVVGLSITLALAAALLLSGQIGLALNIAVFALVVLYFVHSLAVLLLPRLNPGLYRSVTAPIPRSVQVASALVSLAAMGGLVVVQVAQDLAVLRRLTLAERLAQRSLTTLELCLAWAAVGLLLYLAGRRGPGRAQPAEGE
jgi:APA family basic amino acid/polyamine antiporter